MNWAYKMNNSLAVEVQTEYLEEQSQPEEGKYVFAYHITIANHGDEVAKLISRHWIITDGNGDAREVKGLGVVGEQPSIEPGKSYSYSSFAVLDTSVGAMQGSYQMQDPQGHYFLCPIPAFLLAIPGAVN